MSKQNTRETNQMLGLFCIEAHSQLSVLRENMVALRNDPGNINELKSSKTAVTSLKGAAKIASLDQVFELAKTMEAIVSDAVQGKLVFNGSLIDEMDTTIELVLEFLNAADSDLHSWLKMNNKKFTKKISALLKLKNANSDIIVTAKKPEKSRKKSARKSSTTIKSDKSKGADALAEISMLELFRMEANSQAQKLSDGLMTLENTPDNPDLLEELMRAAHSVKGAARMVGLEDSVRISHLMEDVFVAAQNGKFRLETNDMDILLACVDMVANMAKATSADYDNWLDKHTDVLDELTAALSAILEQSPRKKLSFVLNKQFVDGEEIDSIMAANGNNFTETKADNNVVRVSAQSLNRLQGLAGEALVESRWLAWYADSLLFIKKRQAELVTSLDHLREQLSDIKANEAITETMHITHIKANECRDLLSNRLSDLDFYDRRSNSLSHRLHQEVLQARMRPFSDGVQGLQRLVRELARSLNKDVKLDIRGMDTQVDRDILDKLQAPLNHMIRNAVDHGIEKPDDRVAAGKPAQGTIRLEAMHNAGMLSITVQDDGRGIDLEKLRKKIIAGKMINEQMVESLSESELLDFMFLPNFSTRDDITEISGRGVGLNVVQNVVQELRGQIRSGTEINDGTKFQFQLPLTLSVIRALVVDIAGEPYAYPL
ncbi:MAG: Hpt domain-containing protein, partial [Gammaproteobacteria bacterium]